MKRAPSIALMAVCAALAVASAGCSTSVEPGPLRCSSDLDCDEGQLCFPEGCGDPNKDVAVEVVASTRTGYHAQDFAFPTLASSQDIALFAPTRLQGEVQRLSGPPGPAAYVLPFDGAVHVLAIGESDVIPGATRQYEASFTSLDRGAFSMFIGAGTYTVTATPEDPLIPAEVKPDVRIIPGRSPYELFDGQESGFAPFVLQAPNGVRTLSGKLLKVILPGPPEVEVPLTDSGTSMEVQLFTADRKRALSQRVSLSSGVVGATGDFLVAAHPDLDTLTTVSLVATPKRSDAPVPSKSFTLSVPPPANLRLEMGDFGSLATGLTGTVETSTGQPVRGAVVYLEGKVKGGGTFRSVNTITDSNGAFNVSALPSAAGETYTVRILPPASSTAGFLESKAVVLATKPPGGKQLDPDRFICPDKVPVTAVVQLPDGRPAPRLSVIAEPVEALPGRPTPLERVEATTDEEGHLRLLLEPAKYRFDFLPDQGLPLWSRAVTVEVSSSVPPPVLDLKTLSLQKGRQVSGVVTSTSSVDGPPSLAPYATLRFFRISTVEGKRTALLLGRAVTDDRGRYAVVLPAR